MQPVLKACLTGIMGRKAYIFDQIEIDLESGFVKTRLNSPTRKFKLPLLIVRLSLGFLSNYTNTIEELEFSSTPTIPVLSGVNMPQDNLSTIHYAV